MISVSAYESGVRGRETSLTNRFIEKMAVSSVGILTVDCATIKDRMSLTHCQLHLDVVHIVISEALQLPTYLPT
jgi:hypothetical protein